MVSSLWGKILHPLTRQHNIKLSCDPTYYWLKILPQMSALLELMM